MISFSENPIAPAKLNRWAAWALFLIAWPLSGAPTRAQTPSPTPGPLPDIVFIVASDLSASAIGAYGSTIARTPNIDRLAASGALFTRAYCNAPAGPISRQSFFTGKLPHANGASLFHSSLDNGEISLALALGRANYAAWVSGRMRFTVNSNFGFTRPIEEQDRDFYLDRKGFEPIEGEDFQPLEWKPFDAPPTEWLNAANLPIPAQREDVSERFFADRAADIIRQPREEPLLLFAGVRQPSTPFSYPVEFRAMFDPAQLTPPALAPGEESLAPAVFASLSDGEKAGIIAGYHTTMAFVDECVGVVLDAIDAAKRADSTVVIFLSDTGYMLGEHGWFEKNCFYEPAVRVPLIIRWPGQVRPGTVMDQLVELVDLFPTVLDIVNLATPLTPQARSLVPLLTGAVAEHRDYVFSEYLDNEEAMIRDARYKLIYASGRVARHDGLAPATPPTGRVTRLYDLVADPGELDNLANDPAQQTRIERMKRQMLARLADGRDGFDASRSDLSLDERLDILLIPPEKWTSVEIEFRRALDTR